MGQLYDAKVKVEALIAKSKENPTELKGKIGMRIGFLLSLVTPATPDDPVRMERLRKAVSEVLSASL